MTSYLAALAARELGTDVVAQSPALSSRAGAIAPRHVGRYERWAIPVPETIERDAPRPETSGANDRVDAIPAMTRAVVDTSAVTTSASPVRGAVQPSPVAYEITAQRPHASTADDRVDPVVPREIGSLPTPIIAPHLVDRVPTLPVHNRLAMARDETPERKADTVSVSDARHQPAPAAQVTPASRAPVSPVVAPRRVETRDTVREAVAARSQDASPSVVVTIGRIEVRAVPVPPVPRAARVAAPTMSLDDYLRERTRGLR